MEPATITLDAEQSARLAPMIRRARELVGPSKGRKTVAPSMVVGQVDFPFFDARQPERDLTRAELRCGIVSAKAAVKIRKVIAEDCLRRSGEAKPPAPAAAAPRVVAVDFETFYDRDYHVRALGYHGYVHHKKFDAYLVALCADDGWQWVGHPKDAPWDEIDAATWLSHNAQFDRAVFFRLQALGVVPASVRPTAWHCTSALSVYLAAPRSLAGAAEQLVEIKLDKSVRARACGQSGASLFDQTEEMRAYALQDAAACLAIWKAHADKWPEHERRLSTQTIEIGERGIQLNADYLHACIKRLETALAAATAKIPWAKSAAPTSPKQLEKACRAAGIEPPASTAENSPEFEAWQRQHGARFPWVEAMQTFRRANRKLKILQAALVRCKPGHELTFSLKYFGGFTGRWSGDTGLNLQNLNKDRDFDVDVRRMLVPRPGHRLVICDLAQVEPRCLAYLCGDWPLLERIAAGMSVYEAHARATMGWKGGDLKKENPSIYSLAKARCLAEGTLVLTHRGYVPIEQVRVVDMVWDGDEWVHHRGVVCNGTAATVALAGERFTADHLIFHGESAATPAGAISEGTPLAQLAWRKPPGTDWQDIWQLACAVLRSCAQAGRAFCSLPVSWLLARIRRRLAQSEGWKDARLQSMRPEAITPHAQPEILGEANR